MRLERKSFIKSPVRPLHTSYSVNKVLWLRDEKPDLFTQTWKFLLWEDLFCAWLGLTPAIDHSLASRTMVFDIHTKQWSDELLQVSGLSPDQFASVIPAGEPVGEIPSQMAGELGLDKGVLVTVAGHDAVNGAFGAGVYEQGQAVLTIGTAESIVVALEQPMLTKECWQTCMPATAIPILSVTLPWHTPPALETCCAGIAIALVRMI